MKPVEHDAFNSHQRFDYTSAEALYLEAKAALDAVGLVTIPVSKKLRQPSESDRAEKTAGILEFKWILALASNVNEKMELENEWPAVIQSGRPYDKAVAIAHTSALAYMLRDLLLIPRVDASDDMNHHGEDDERDDDNSGSNGDRVNKAKAKKDQQEAQAKSDIAVIVRLRKQLLEAKNAETVMATIAAFDGETAKFDKRKKDFVHELAEARKAVIAGKALSSSQAQAAKRAAELAGEVGGAD